MQRYRYIGTMSLYSNIFICMCAKFIKTWDYTRKWNITFSTVYFASSMPQHHANMTYLQTRIILNKADQVRPEELMRVQGTLIWNISPLMSSSEPPVMYSTSLWSLPYEAGAPTRLLHAQERAFLRDLRDAIDKRVENKIASARRFAVSICLFMHN